MQGIYNIMCMISSASGNVQDLLNQLLLTLEPPNYSNQNEKMPATDEEDVDLSDESFLAALEYQADDTNGDFTFENLKINQSTMAQRNLQSQDSSKT